MTTRPHFLGIGAVKAGTTWLHHNLARHPDVWMPPIKELRYFDEPRRDLARRLLDPFPPRPADPRRYQHWRRELIGFLRAPNRWLGPRRLTWHLRYFLGRRDPAWYARLFRPAGERLAGEISPLYALLDDDGVDFARRSFPGLKILYVLRDPIERTWSHVLLRCLGLAGWRWERVTPELVETTFRHRDLADARLWRNNDYTRVLERWERRFGAGHVGVFFHDDLVAEPAALLADVLRFLELDPGADPAPETSRRRRHATPRRPPLPARLETEIARRVVADLERLACRYDGIHAAPGRWLERARRAARGESAEPDKLVP